MPEGTALERVARPVSITERRRTNYDVGQLDLIKSQIMHEDATDAELAIFLELCARYELDPFAKQVWSIKIRRKVQAVIAHAGLLSLAERHTPAGAYQVVGPGQYLGTHGDVVREYDFFSKIEAERADETAKVLIKHEYLDTDGKPTHGGRDGSLRGQIIGSWARVRRQGFDDRYFFAYRASYDKGENTWLTHPDFMMLKCAQTVALRQAFSVSGFVGAEEVGQSKLGDAITMGNGTTGGGDVEWPENAELATALKEAFSVAGWPLAKQRLHVNGKTEAEHREVIARIHREMDREPEEPITDADVVEEQPPLDESQASA